MKKLTALVLAVLLSLNTGCSIFVPSHQMMSVQVSDPPHSKVWINGVFEGEAPVQARVMRNHDVGVIVKKDGFQTSQQVVQYHLNTTGILDIVGTCLFLVPVVGLISPGANSLDETTLIFHLAPEENQMPSVNAPTAAPH